MSEYLRASATSRRLLGFWRARQLSRPEQKLLDNNHLPGAGALVHLAGGGGPSACPDAWAPVGV